MNNFSPSSKRYPYSGVFRLWPMLNGIMFNTVYEGNLPYNRSPRYCHLWTTINNITQPTKQEMELLYAAKGIKLRPTEISPVTNNKGEMISLYYDVEHPNELYSYNESTKEIY